MARCTNTFLIAVTFFQASMESMLLAYPVPVDFDGTLLRWNRTFDNPTLSVQVDGEEHMDLGVLKEIVSDSINLWNDVSSSYIRLSVTENSPADITITFKSQLDDSPYAAGFAIFDGIDEKIGPTHCSISVLEEGLFISSLQKTVLHEIGHCLGLGHSLIPEAIMSYRPDKNEFKIDLDDAAALTLLYPNDGTKPGLPPGCSIGEHQKARSLNLISNLIFLLPLVPTGLFIRFCKRK